MNNDTTVGGFFMGEVKWEGGVAIGNHRKNRSGIGGAEHAGTSTKGSSGETAGRGAETMLGERGDVVNRRWRYEEIFQIRRKPRGQNVRLA